MPATPQYDAATTAAALFTLEDRTQLELRGADRVSFLQNLTTNDIQRLGAGEGCEAFVTSVQGKILGHVYVFAGPESLVLETVAGQSESLTAHLEKYQIREEVEVADRSRQWAELLLVGPQTDELLKGLASGERPAHPLSHGAIELAGVPVWLRRTTWTSLPEMTVAVERERGKAISTALLDAGAQPCNLETLDVLRLEAGTPQFGLDITERNLPQEVDRNERAISFTKGCYLGQETVARIDALGHVNRLLRGVRFSGGEVPAPGLELSRDGKAVGAVTSAVFSPALEAPLALAYLRSGSAAPDTRLDSPLGEAIVVQPPVT